MATKRPEARLRKPRILVIGGEASRNFGSKDLLEAFDIELVEKGRTTIPRFKNEVFDAVVLLPWRIKEMLAMSKNWAAARGIPYYRVKSTGAIRFYLGEQLPHIKEYLESLEKKAKLEAKVEPVKEVEPASSVLWDEDQLWSAYGEPFVQAIRGLDGETTDRKTFVDLLEQETGLRGEPVEILMSILRRQGVVAEHEGGIVAVGKVATIDVDKRKKFIEREGLKSAKALESGKVAPVGLEGMPDETVMMYFAKLVGLTFKNTKFLYNALGELGIGRNGKPFCDEWMRRFTLRAEGLGFVRERTGNGYEVKIILKDPHAKPAADPPEKKATKVEVPAVQPVKISPLPGQGGTMAKSLDALFGAPVVPAVAPAAPAELVPVQPPSDLDLAKDGVAYGMLEKICPEGRLPELGGLIAAVRAFKGLFFENQWDVSAAKGILHRLKIQTTDPNVRRLMSRKLDFTDDEWSYFALEYLRDQTLFSLLPMIDVTNRIWKICEECQQHFHYNIPRSCKDCWDVRKGIIGDAKGGNS